MVFNRLSFRCAPPTNVPKENSDRNKLKCGYTPLFLTHFPPFMSLFIEQMPVQRVKKKKGRLRKDVSFRKLTARE